MNNITIHDIAKIVGCSSGTVSRAINNRPGINSETRKKILQVMDDLGYRPNAIAQSLASQQTHTIALIIPDISTPFLSSIALAADKELFKHRYNMMVCNTYWDTEVQRQKLAFSKEKRVDGILLKPTTDDIDYVKSLDIPTVFVSHSLPGDTNYIDIENETAAFKATAHLASCGYRRIAFVGGVDSVNYIRLRLDGYRKALDAYHLPQYPEYIWQGDYTIQTGYRAMEYFLSLSEPPDALFCNLDELALGAYQKCLEAGLHVPHDIGLVGFNDDEIASLALVNLTTVAQPKNKIGQLAAQTLMQMIENPVGWHPQKTLMYPELIVRGTTRPIALDK